MQIRLKTVTNENDIALAAQLAREIWHEHYDALLGSAQVDYMLSHFQSETAIKEQIGNGTVYLLAYWDDEPAGYCAYRPEEERMSWRSSSVDRMEIPPLCQFSAAG